MIEITIKNGKIPTNEIHVSGKNRWCKPSSWCAGYQTQVTLSEKEIYENAARAIAELEQAKEELAAAQQRVDTLRMFASELHQPQPLENQ